MPIDVWSVPSETRGQRKARTLWPVALLISIPEEEVKI
jgi:hypothetical protein